MCPFITTMKKKVKVPIRYNPHLPNEAHRAEQWAGGRVERNRKKYNRKAKHKGLDFERSL